MITAVKSLAKLAQTGQSLALAGENLKLVKKKKKKSKDFLKAGIKNIVGIKLISETGKAISRL